MNKSKTKIAVYTTGDFPYGGASESFVRQMALGLDETGAKVEVILWRGNRFGHKNDTPVPSRQYLFRKPFTNELLKFIELISLIAFIPFSLLFRKFVKKDTHIILYGFEYSYIVLPFIVCSKLLNLRVFRIITDYYQEKTIAPVWWKKNKWLFYKIQFKYVDRFLDGVIVLTKFLYDYCQFNKVSPKNLLLIPHFIDLNINQNIQTTSKYDLGFCGNISEKNGILDLLTAYKKVICIYPDTKLLIVGFVPEEINRKIKESDWSMKGIVFTGLVLKNQVADLISQCKILINPRQAGKWADAGFPTKIGEYFATKNSVVTTRVGDLPVYFRDKKELVFAEPNNPDSLVDAIIYLLNDNKSREYIGTKGNEWALRNLDYINNAKKLLSFINNKP